MATKKPTQKELDALLRQIDTKKAVLKAVIQETQAQKDTADALRKEEAGLSVEVGALADEKVSLTKTLLGINGEIEEGIEICKINESLARERREEVSIAQKEIKMAHSVAKGLENKVIKSEARLEDLKAQIIYETKELRVLRKAREKVTAECDELEKAQKSQKKKFKSGEEKTKKQEAIIEEYNDEITKRMDSLDSLGAKREALAELIEDEQALCAKEILKTSKEKAKNAKLKEQMKAEKEEHDKAVAKKNQEMQDISNVIDTKIAMLEKQKRRVDAENTVKTLTK